MSLNPFLSSELIICQSFLKGQMIKAALTKYPSICKPLHCKKGTFNLPFSSAYRRSILAFSICWLEVFQYHKCLFGILFQSILFIKKAVKIDSAKQLLQIFCQLENYFFPTTYMELWFLFRS